MKRLGLLRHAKSDWDDLSLRDFDRGLNARGRRGAALIGGHLREQPWTWDLLLASPAERVKLTLESAALGMEPKFVDGLYLAHCDEMISLLQQQDDALESVLLVGHNPGLQDLTLELAADEDDTLLTQAAMKFPTATFAVLELDVLRWRDLRPRCGRLVHFTRPRDLDPELGPEAGG